MDSARMKDPKSFQIILLTILFIRCAHLQTPVFLVDPVSVAAIDGITVEFSCTAENTNLITFRVNGSSATLGSVISKGFVQSLIEELGSMTLRRNLIIKVSSTYNNTEIFCRAEGTPNVDSKVVNLTVQDFLSSVNELSHSFINTYTVNISWSPPFTIPGTVITGYNISVTSNGTTTNDFTLDIYYVLQLSDITDSPCDEINITVSGYNGLNGEPESISGEHLSSVPRSDVTIPVTVKAGGGLQLLVMIYVNHLHICEHPSTINIDLFSNDALVDGINDVMLPQDIHSNVLAAKTTLTVLEDQRYTAIVSFRNLGGNFNTKSITNFVTFGVQSVVITDATGGRVCLECSFSSFNTDTGCTVELVSSGSVQYTETFNRSGNTAEGCVSGVTTGQYAVNVYDEGSDQLVLTLAGVTVITLLSSINTSTNTPLCITKHCISNGLLSHITDLTNSVGCSVTSTVTVVSQFAGQSGETGSFFVGVGFTAGFLTAFLVSLLVIISVFVWNKRKGKNHNRDSPEKHNDGGAVLTSVNPAYGDVKNTNTTRIVYETVK